MFNFICIPRHCPCERMSIIAPATWSEVGVVHFEGDKRETTESRTCNTPFSMKYYIHGLLCPVRRRQVLQVHFLSLSLSLVFFQHKI